MNCLRALLFIALLIGVVLPLPTHGDSAECPGFARLGVGGIARVAYGQDTDATLHEYPQSDARDIGSVPQGTPLSVTRGPICAANTRWWQVRTLSGQSGWASESAPGGSYALEPWQILVDMPQRSAAGFDIVRVNAHGLLRMLTHFDVPHLAGTVREVFPPHESAPLDQAFAATAHDCPDMLRRSDPLAASLSLPGDSPADLLSASAYIAPDATRLLIVRHLWRSLICCDGTRSLVYGIERVSLIDGGGEHAVFDLPANANWPGVHRADGALNRVVDVSWSPDNRRALIWLRYGDHDRLMMFDSHDGLLTSFDDGTYPVWTPGGTHLEWLRADGDRTNIILAQPDGFGRQTIALPADLQFTGAPLAPLWNSRGTWLAACERANQCASVVVMDVIGRQALPTLHVPLDHPAGACWVSGDTALLWIPRGGGAFAVQRVRDGSVYRISVALAADEHITDARAFPGGDSGVDHHSKQRGRNTLHCPEYCARAAHHVMNEPLSKIQLTRN